MSYTQPSPRSTSGIHYFAEGWRLISRPGIKRYVVLPLLVNVLLMGSAFWWLFSRLGDWIPAMMSHVPDWLQWLSYLLWPLAVISVLLVFSYLFSTITNLIAAPFCGLLAEQLEGSLTGKPLPDTGLLGIAKDLPRIMAREWRKLMYYLPRALLLLALYFVPGIGQTVAPVLWFLFSAWMLAIQYCDYPFDAEAGRSVPCVHPRRRVGRAPGQRYARGRSGSLPGRLDLSAGETQHDGAFGG